MRQFQGIKSGQGVFIKPYGFSLAEHGNESGGSKAMQVYNEVIARCSVGTNES